MTLKTLRDLLIEVRTQLSPTAIKAMYEKGRQDNPEGEVARNMYKKFTGQDWKADKPAVVTPTIKTDSTPPPKDDKTKKGLEILKEIFDMVEKAIKMGDDVKLSSLTSEQSALLFSAGNLFHDVLTNSSHSASAFIDSLSEDDYISLGDFIDSISRLRYTKKKLDSTSPFVKSFEKIKKQFITKESSTKNSDIGKYLKEIFFYIDGAITSRESAIQYFRSALKIYRLNNLIDKLDSEEDEDELGDIMQELVDMINDDEPMLNDRFVKSYKKLKIKFQKYM